jgi:hypothetical protein
MAVLSAVEAAALGPRMLRGNQVSEKLYRDKIAAIKKPARRRGDRARQGPRDRREAPLGRDPTSSGIPKLDR